MQNSHAKEAVNLLNSYDNSRVKNVTYDYDDFGNVIYKHDLGDTSDSNDDKSIWEVHHDGLMLKQFAVKVSVGYSRVKNKIE